MFFHMFCFFFFFQILSSFSERKKKKTKNQSLLINYALCFWRFQVYLTMFSVFFKLKRSIFLCAPFACQNVSVTEAMSQFVPDWNLEDVHILPMTTQKNPMGLVPTFSLPFL